jgi:hypothetical protein
MRITGVAIENYRSINKAELKDCKTINILVGRNGSGKSNILSALQNAGHVIIAPPVVTQGLPDTDFWNKSSSKYSVSFSTIFEWNEIKELGFPTGKMPYREAVTVTIPARGSATIDKKDRGLLIELLRQGRRYEDRYIKQAHTLLDKGLQQGMRAEVLPPEVIGPPDIGASESREVRQLDAGLSLFHPCIDTLQTLEKEEDNTLKEIITQTKRVLPEVSSILASVAGQRRAVKAVLENSRALPFGSLSDGIRRVMLLSAYLVTHKGEPGIVILDMPETYLHPGAQRELLRLITDHSENKHFFIATHSPVFLEEIEKETVAVYRIWRDPKEGTKAELMESGTILEAYFDLGHRFGSAVQADAVIWVEGPTDIPVVRLWLRNYDKLNGLNIEVMHLGGNNIKSADFDPVILCKINPHSFVLIDSEREARDKPIEEKREAFLKRCESAKIQVSQATEHRAIENYLIMATPEYESAADKEALLYASPNVLKAKYGIGKGERRLELAKGFADQKLQQTDIGNFFKKVVERIVTTP